MNKQRIYGSVQFFSCKEIKVILDESKGTRWLTIEGKTQDATGKLTLFFDSQKDEEAILTFLYNELGKLQTDPKRKILFRKFS